MSEIDEGAAAHARPGAAVPLGDAGRRNAAGGGELADHVERGAAAVVPHRHRLQPGRRARRRRPPTRRCRPTWRGGRAGSRRAVADLGELAGGVERRARSVVVDRETQDRLEDADAQSRPGAAVPLGDVRREIRRGPPLRGGQSLAGGIERLAAAVVEFLHHLDLAAGADRAPGGAVPLRGSRRWSPAARRW